MDRDPVAVDLALQGGGSHGAFTWGVLDRLLEEPWLRIDGISGTSAGAMNAAVLADGLAEGGAAGARAALDAFWERVSDAARFSPLQRGPLDTLLGPLDARLLAGLRRHRHRWRGCSRPTTSIRVGSNPLRADPRGEHRFRRGWPRSPIKLFITATNVRTGRGRVFRNAEITPDVLLASACLPTMFQAVEIDGEPTGTAAMRATRPSRRWCASATRTDTILVQINPIERPGTPRIRARHPQPPERGVLQRHADEGAAHDRAAAPGGRSRARARARAGRGCACTAIASEMMIDLGYSSKLNAEWDFLVHAARRGARVRRTTSWTRTRERHRQALDRSISTCCWRGSERWACSASCSASALLIWLAYRGWSVLLLAPAAALVAAAFARRAAARALDADLHGQRGAVPRAVLSAVPARRAVRQADGGQRLGRGDRAAS